MTDSPSPLPGSTIVTPVQVMFFDTDAGGVVHNIAYLRFIETARTLLAVQLGMDWARMARTSLYPVVVRTEIDYKRPAILGDELEVHGRLGEATPARFWCHFEIKRPRGGALLITCQQALAFVKMPEGKPLRLPKGWPEPFAPELVAPSGE
jgi:YbgC/YbaW family acyl-CoA thioester hydrolase